ncbi:MAG: hypothetical protein JRE28_10425 [Deltaproteobacteria bacterium]|nr:hypothetical protein [Deltaproteobacteria bacterium]
MAFTIDFAGVQSDSEAQKMIRSVSPQWKRNEAKKTWARVKGYVLGQAKSTTSTPSVAKTSGTPASVAEPFKQALDTLSGAGSDVEKMYQAGKRRAMSNIAMQSVSAGMANTLNMPAAELAYEGEVRPGTNVAVAGQKANVLQNLGQTAAGIYGTQVGAETSRYGIDVGSRTSLQTAQMGAGAAATSAGLNFASNRANQALQKYIADLKHSSSGALSQASLPGAPRV